MRWLIATALDGSTMTYGEVKGRLEKEASFSTIFATRIGLVAGELMYKIQQVEPKAPLINVIVVNQEDRQPSKGAGSFMAKRFGNPRLAKAGYKQRHPRRWKSYFERAAAEVYAYSPQQWAELYRRVFETSLVTAEIQEQRQKRQLGTEQDGVPTGRSYGSEGEGEYHKALRLWIRDNPHRVRRAFIGARTDTEFDLDSGDRVDCVYHLAEHTIVIEVKSRISNLVDLRRGVFQCIKYRAVKEAMDVRTDVPVEAMLVTEGKLPGEIAALLRQHQIRHFQAPLNRT
jgi:hypothetical protein